MPKGPRGERRPADVIGAAIMVGRIATGERTDEVQSTEVGKDHEASRMGRKGGVARAAAMSPEERAKAAKKSALARWRR